MKKFYTLAFLAACVTASSAQTEFTSDVTISEPYEYDYSGNVTITNCTVTIGFEEGNSSALPFYSGETITLSEGGKVKFFDSPETAYPVADLYDAVAYSSGDLVQELPFHWVIEGDGNEIYLDSYCTMAGTISGNGTLTIYASKKNVLNFEGYYNPTNPVLDFPAFDGTIYIKALDGYECDTLQFGSAIRSGYYNGTESGLFSFSANKMDIYAATSMILDVAALNNPVISCAATFVPQIEGECIVNMPSSWTVLAPAAVTNGYDAIIEGGGTADRFCHITGGPLIMNEASQFNATYANFFNRSTSTIIINSTKPSFSNTTTFSMRGASLVCGNGYLDTQAWGNSGRATRYSAGDSAVGSVGTLTIRDLHIVNGNVIDVDFDNAGNADRLVVPGTVVFNSGRNDFNLRLPSDFFVNPKVKNYKVIQAGTYNADMKYLSDTIGFYFLDGTGYMVLHSYDADNSGANDTTKYGNAAALLSAWPDAQITLVNNREVDTLRVWERGTYANDSSAYSETYKNTTSPDLYTPNHPWAFGGALNYIITDPDNWFYTQMDALNAVKVVPGCPDSVCYNGHNLGTVIGSSFGDFQGDNKYIGAITYPYYYWSDNTIQLNGFTSGTYSAPDGSSFNIEYKGTTDLESEVPTFAMSAYTWPITRYVIDSTKVNEDLTKVYDTVQVYQDWTTKASPIRVPQVNKDTIYYWFDFSNIFTTGNIALCAQTHKADGTVEEEVIPNNDDVVDIKTTLKETHAVASRVIRTLDGRRVNNYQRGLNIVTTKYTDGTIETKKVFFAR